MNCPSCGVVNEDGKKFCTECGTPLGRACPSCGAALSGTDKFCGECGTSVAVEAAPTQAPDSAAPTPAAERRLVSVLFADLVGFTSASEQRDAEETRELLSRYFDTCRRLIELYGGTVEKFIGDAVMAVWGTPVATEDDAERAVRAALDLVAAVSALGDEVGAENLRARAGIMTGEAAVTIGAEGEGMVAGDLVNTASRVQSAAEPGTVFVGEATRRATDQAVVYETAGKFELKGKEGQTPLWRALRVVSGVGGQLKSEGLEAPFVGRERELRQIKELFHVCADEKRAHLISVTGIAGIGKSRLAWEFYKYFDGLTQIIYWHRGRCLSYGEGVTYWALADMVKMRCRIVEDDEPETARQKLRTALDEHILDPEERRFVEPRLAQLLALAEGESHDRQDLFAAWRLFFERLADTYPTVLAFEDMQWADPSLLDFVEYLLEWSRNHPLYVITLARPELLERRTNWGAGHRNFTSLYLEPLSDEAMQDLLQGLVPGLPSALREQILARAEGVPLYAIETVRMLLDRGLVVEDGPSYRVVGEVEALEVPETLHALVAARLDGLPAEERRLVQDASVLGKSFAPDALAASTTVERARVETLLQGLVRREILGLQSDPRSPEQGQYAFLQDLLRHVAYETLPKRERKAKHLAAAAFLEESWAGEEGEVVEVVASHFLQAYSAAPEDADAPELRLRARDLLVKAADRAASLAASAEARHFYEQALELTDEALARAELLERAGVMALRSRDGDAEGLLRSAIEAFEEQGRPHPAARVSAQLAELESESGQLAQAVQRMEQAFAVLVDDEPGADVAALAAQLGRVYMFEGRLAEAMERCELALGVAEALDLPEVFSQALNTRAGLLRLQGRPRESRVLLEYALSVALEHDLSEAALRAYWNLMVGHASFDRWGEVAQLIERGLELARRAGVRQYESEFLAARVEPLVELGRWDDAEDAAAELEGREGREDSMWDLGAEANLAMMCAARGNTPRAREHLARLAPLATSDTVEMRVLHRAVEAAVLGAEGRHGEALHEAEKALAAAGAVGGIANLNARVALVAGLDAAFALGDAAAAERLLTHVREGRPGESMPSLRAHEARTAARLALLRGDAVAVAPAFEAAAAIFRDIPLPYWHARTLAEHGEWLVREGRAAEAEPLLAEARETFARLDAGPWLERMDALEPGVEAVA